MPAKQLDEQGPRIHNIERGKPRRNGYSESINACQRDSSFGCRQRWNIHHAGVALECREHDYSTQRVRGSLANRPVAEFAVAQRRPATMVSPCVSRLRPTRRLQRSRSHRSRGRPIRGQRSSRGKCLACEKPKATNVSIARKFGWPERMTCALDRIYNKVQVGASKMRPNRKTEDTLRELLGDWEAELSSHRAVGG